MSRDHNEEGEKRPFDKRGENRDQDKRTGRGEGFKPRERDGERRPREFGARDGEGRDGRERRDRDDKPRFEKKFGDKPRFDKGDAPRSRDVGDRDASVEEAERIAKRLARAGIASRREAETMIAAGRISVNGKVLTTPAFNVNRTDIIKVDGKLLPQTERTRLWLYHKPAGLVTTNRDPEGRPTVFEALPEDMPRVLSVGRLDINTEGLLLLTNDGGLSRILELPTTGWLRRYRVRAHGSVTQEQLDELKNGIAVDGIFYGSIDAQLERQQGSNVWLNIGLREGKNREVKNILGALGLTVGRLIRVSFGPFQLSDLEVGAVREIRGRTLRDQLGERLVQESGADFDAPIINEFSNSDVRGAGIRAPRGDEAQQDERPRRPREWISSSPSQGKPKRTERVEESRRPRGVNVWMAPGARPQSAKAEAAAEERSEYQKRERKPFGEARGGAPRGERSDRPFRSNDRDRQGGFERKPRDGDYAPRPRRSDDEGSFQKRSYGEGRGERSERFDRAPRPEGDRRPRAEGASRPRFDDEQKRPGRRERERENAREARRTEDFAGGYSRGEKSRDARPFGDKPRSDKPWGDKPRSDRPRGDKPFGDKPRSDKPWGDKPRGDKPHSERPQNDRPRGDKPFRDGPSGSGNRSGGKPGGRGADRRR
ncbi:pseudouridine synthase [Paenochrobactrum sp. BZR 588]|uniref:pseudouridine synthase n=1 Tax=unclassified Paenochrobactrum TaxID=2639760 RepID=UPI003854F303